MYRHVAIKNIIRGALSTAKIPSHATCPDTSAASAEADMHGNSTARGKKRSKYLYLATNPIFTPVALEP